MGIFDLDCNNCNCGCGNNNSTGGTGNMGTSKVTKDECIIAPKVYDSCRQQDCLTSDVLGPARANAEAVYCGTSVQEGGIITPPANAAAVTIDNLALASVVIVSKTPSPFRNGYWDIDLKYVFNYTLTFRDIAANELCSVVASSVYNKRVSLFGSITTGSLISTDLLSSGGNSADLSADPFILVESKAIALGAELKYNNCCCDDNTAQEVAVTIGLFTIIKLFRLVNLIVESKGFCVPPECEDVSNLTPCEFFDSLDFPLDIFAPPQKEEFFAGISSNIPNPAPTPVPPNGCCNNKCSCCK